RLFHKNMDALLDRVLKMYPPKSQRRGENRHVSRAQSIQRVLVSVKSEKLPVLVYLDVLAHLLIAFQSAKRVIQLVLKHIRQSDKFRASFLHRESILGCAAPATPTPNE